MAGCWLHFVDSKNTLGRFDVVNASDSTQISTYFNILQHPSTSFNILQPWSKNEATSDISQRFAGFESGQCPFFFGQLPHFGDPRTIPEVHKFSN
jgi:hypothetical protein